MATNISNSRDGSSRPNTDTDDKTCVSLVAKHTLASRDEIADGQHTSGGSDAANPNLSNPRALHDSQSHLSPTNVAMSAHACSLESSEVDGHVEETPLPKSLPPAFPPRRQFKASCTHPTMTRVYGVNHRCDTCGTYPPFGWLYRCTQDREELLRQMIHVGSEQAVFDDLGRKLIDLVKPRPRGPETRMDTIGSFFSEITPEQLQTYRPDQIAIILKQRENVKTVLQQDAAKKQNEAEQQLSALQAIRHSHFDAVGFHSSPPASAPGLDEVRWQELERERPWIPHPEMECTFKVCQQCRPSGADRISMSLDGIVKGDVPATAATGFGFHNFGQRPVCDISVVARLGLTPSATRFFENDEHDAPVGSSVMGTPSSDGYSMTNLDDLMARQEQQFREWQQLRQQGRSEDSFAILSPNGKGHLPRSPGSPDLKHAADTDMEVHEMKTGEFESAPLVVDDGIAVLEESLELHVPDVVTQV
ncbi:hypothetical protein D7B24_003070 [Verticillium nonalfalfae]|uniref:Uncharacterized protein n=1 Tax=Verticillium nonalfalfae TaxID=1051616 RepID=A0A3M9XXF7_9PEZI|nr:uncharacterized protein D7B24_003070 [Verticillium nonalfalfae]RNJ52701.1 hypothetical protein D7B24_003070 [Verticillium nonalfalfae]